ncbi:MAG TPA: hypothetical protein VLX44_20590 [Xanthobacteraceae bacterium]|nr:hypothetical protein [Xanthobacteraceae bacterium]
MNTKIVLTAFGLAALLAAPAFAQKHAHRAYAPGPYASVNGPSAIEGHTVIGTDPDPQIRFELERDSSTYTSTN